MSFGSFFKNPLKLHKEIVRNAAPGNVKKNTYKGLGWRGGDGAGAPSTGYQRDPALQARLDAFGADQKLADARAKFAAQFGRQPTGTGAMSQRPPQSMFANVAGRIAATRGAQPPAGVPAWQAGVPGAGVNPAAAQNPMAKAGRIPGYADGGKVINRKPNGKGR